MSGCSDAWKMSGFSIYEELRNLHKYLGHDGSRNFVFDRVPLDGEAERISVLIFRWLIQWWPVDYLNSRFPSFARKLTVWRSTCQSSNLYAFLYQTRVLDFSRLGGRKHLFSNFKLIFTLLYVSLYTDPFPCSLIIISCGYQNRCQVISTSPHDRPSVSGRISDRGYVTKRL
jgi:hypothetical protein